MREEQRHIEHVLDSLTGSLAGVARRAHRGARRPARHRLRAGLGDRHRQDRYRDRRAGDVPRRCGGGWPSWSVPDAAERTRMLYGGSVKPEQRGGAAGRARRRRGARRRSQPRRRRLLRHRARRPAGRGGEWLGRRVTLQLRLIDEPAAQAIVAGRCPAVYPLRTGLSGGRRPGGGGDVPGAGARRASIRARLAPSSSVSTSAEAYRPTDPADPAPRWSSAVSASTALRTSRAGSRSATASCRRIAGRAMRRRHCACSSSRPATSGAARLIAETEADNVPSQAVLRRVGFTRFAEDERNRLV